MLPQAPWSPTAHAFAQHQFSQVANFWKQGRQASLRLEALPGGQAVLNLTFQLPSATEIIPPPSNVHTVPTTQRPIIPLFPKGFPQGSPSASPKVSSKQRKNYQRSVLHRAGLAASSLPSPKYGSLRQAASACVQRLQTDQASKVTTEKSRKRPLQDSPNVLSPSNCSPLAQRIRSDLQIGEGEVEVESPERELLRTQSSPEKSPCLSSPLYMKSLPSPAPLVFTPLKTKDQSDVLEIAEAVEVDEADTALSLSCSNCEGKFTPGHQCDDSPAPLISASKCAVLGKESPTPAPLPLCHYCCHLGSGLNPVHYYMQCLCADKVCSCQCYCTEEQLKHKRKFFSSGFIGNNCVDINDRPRAKAIAEARANKLDYRGIPMAQRPCEAETCIRM